MPFQRIQKKILTINRIIILFDYQLTIYEPGNPFYPQ